MAKGRLPAFLLMLLLAAPALPCPSEQPSAQDAGRQPPASGEWVISSAESFSMRTLLLNGNLTIQSGGSLTLTKVKLTLSPGFDGEFHIEVQSGGALVIQDQDHSPASPDDASVVSSSSGFQYQFWVRPGGSLYIESSVVRNCGHALGLRGETAGVYIQSSSCTASNSTFTDCYAGIAVDNCAPLISNCTFTQNRKHGMYARDSTLTLENNVFDGNAAHGLALQACSPVLRRNIFRGNTQDGLNAQSSPLVLESNIFQLNKRRAVDAEGSPVRSAGDQLIENAVGYYVTGATVDCEAPYLESNNYCFFLREVRASVRNATMLRTGMVELSLGWSSGHTEFISYNNTIHNVTFEDASSFLRVEWLVRPRVLWESSRLPVPGALVKFFRADSNELLLTGTANDTGELPPMMMAEYEQTRAGRVNTGAYRIGVFSGRFVESVRTAIDRDMDLDLLLDDVPPAFTLASPRDNLTTNARSVWVNGTMLTDLDAVLTVNGAPAEIDPYTGNFSVRVELAEGPNALNITAVDPIFNVFTALRTVIRHSLPPNLTIDVPPAGLLLNRTRLVVRGATEPGAYVIVNGVPALVNPDGSFESELELSEGPNNLTVYSADQYRNFAWANRTIVVDTLPPAIAVLSPLNGSLTNRPRLTVAGQSEDGAAVLLDGVSLPADHGNFTASVNLTEGPNRLVFWAVDAAGNRNSTALIVWLDTVPPAASVLFPPEGAAVNYTPVNITGTTEPGVSVSCRGGTVFSDGRGNFSVLYQLQEGPNSVPLEFRDPAGNRFQMTLHIVYDTVVSFSLVSPENGTRTEDGFVVVEGRAEPGAAVTIDGRNATVDPNGAFRAKVPLRPGKNVLVVNVTDAAGNRARFFVLVRREAPAGLDMTVLALAALAVAAAGAGAGVWLIRARRERAAASAPPPAPGPTLLDNQRLVLKAAEAPRERLRCAACLQPVDESWAQCHTCGGPTALSRIAPATRQRLEDSEFPDERGQRLRAVLLKGFADIALLEEAGEPARDELLRLCIASQLLLAGEKPEAAERMASELERELGERAGRLAAGKKAALEKARGEARLQIAAMLEEAERTLPGLRAEGAQTRELEKALGLARLHLRGDNFEKAYQHTMDARGILEMLRGRGA
jgi:parallel beta-helix repeat protein